MYYHYHHKQNDDNNNTDDKEDDCNLMLWSGGLYSFVFGRYKIQIVIQKLAILSDDFNGFILSLGVNVKLVPQMRAQLLLSTCFLILYQVIILTLDAECFELLIMLSKP
jgi:hypothetical protein